MAIYGLKMDFGLVENLKEMNKILRQAELPVIEEGFDLLRLNPWIYGNYDSGDKEVPAIVFEQLGSVCGKRLEVSGKPYV